MMKRFFYLLLFLISSPLIAQNEVSATIGTQEIKIGEQTTIELEVSYSAAIESLIFPALQDTISKFIDIVEISKIDTIFDPEDVTKKYLNQTITITSWDSGYYVIPPFTFVVGSDTLKTNPLVLNVKNVSVEAQQDIKDIKTIIEVPFSLIDWLLSNKIPISIGLLIVILLILAIVFYRRYKNRPVVEKEVVVPKEAADLVATRKLQELFDKKLWQAGHVKMYYSELSFILREYLENRYLVNALELTTDETITLINSNLIAEKETVKKLHNILILADMAKFAKQQPIGAENEEAYKNALLFVSLTKYVNEPKEEKTND
ncbi:MAG: hypothetical protein DWP98_08285 [Bacteroidetes bacterium]|nr:MAG: hypothetical protein DWP98_08285 [Bacteroidota bacterium]MBL1145288.1 hypothetical protein [Bacteroidota bacterium]NOG58085.1 hypothetical protein [Bacteroidota bacterium]